MQQKRITNPQDVSEMLHFFFVRIEKFKKQREKSSVTAKNKQFFKKPCSFSQQLKLNQNQ